jgi:hypothetical protein
MSLLYKEVNINTINGTELVSSSQFLYLLDFLNTSRAGSAQKAAGISFQTFLSSLVVSAIYCVFQVVVFSLLRTRFNNIYQPNCYYVPDDEKVEPLDEGLFSWLPLVILFPLKNYLSLGMDAYFFLRYLWFLLLLFLGLAIFNIPVLIPVNYISGYDSYTARDLLNYTNGTYPRVEGLDSISMSNIAPLYSSRLSIHLTMALISILWFHLLLIIELNHYVKQKNIFLGEEKYFNPRSENRDYNNTILIDNVPTKYLDRKLLRDLFDQLCGARLKNIWFVYDYGEIRNLYENEKKKADKLERLLTSHIISEFYDQNNTKTVTDRKVFNNGYWRHVFNNWKFVKFDFEPGWHRPTIGFSSMKTLLRYAESDFLQNHKDYNEKKLRLITRERSPLTDHKYNKVFIQFKDPLHPEILNQIRISEHLNELDKTLIYINPKDIVWINLSVQSNLLVFARTVFGNLLTCGVVVGWVIPVAFIGLISQLPYMTALIPFLSWLNYLPTYVTDVISNLVSVILLMVLTELVPHIFRWISFIKCKRTGAEIEIDVQKVMFIFLFIHIFLVVTISSGFTVIFEGLVNNPVSIPNILATNLPKCSNFFFSYMVIRGLSYSGNNLLQINSLFCNTFVYPFIDVTPRDKFKRLSALPQYQWGSIYPTFSVLGSIGLIYCILSPLILVFCILAFSLVFISFKYTLKYQYNMENISENYGQHYPRALFQLYSGIYFMEACLIGLFALSRDENGEANCLCHAMLTFSLLVATGISQHQIESNYARLLSKNTPMTINRHASQYDENDCGSGELDHKMYNDTFYQECFQHNSKVIWVPKDPYNVSADEVAGLCRRGIEASNASCELSNNGEVIVYSNPPDYVK